MFFAVLLTVIIAFGGLALSYPLVRRAPLLWRLAAGCVMGSVIYGTTVFLAASAAGLSAATAALSLFPVLLPLLLLRGREVRERFRADRRHAMDRLQGKGFRRALPFIYYTFFLLLFILFFDRTMYETSEGIFTGGSQNLGDLPFHLGAILSFTEINNFPPMNPSFAGAKFSYPFIADLLTAAYMKFGVELRDAMVVQNVSWAFALLIIFERFILSVTGDRLASRIGPMLLLFSGGLGFVAFFSDFFAQSKGLVEFLWSLPTDYTIGERFRWGNSMVVMFMTQRSLLLGMALTLVVLGYLWSVFSGGDTNAKERGRSHPASLAVPVGFGVLAGLLPLVHLHSLAVLFVVSVFLLAFKPAFWKPMLAFAAGVCLTAVPELVWSMSGSASETAKFFEWHFGWDKRENSFLWFWFTNTGIFIPVLAAGLWLVWKGAFGRDAAADATAASPREPLLFYVPFAFLFLLANSAKLAPWEWDNIKVLVYWFAGSIPFAALFLAWLWRRPPMLRTAAVVSIAVLTLSGALDVWRTVSGQINYGVFGKDAVLVASRIRQRTPPGAVFLNAPTYNSPVALTGRQSVMRYAGHLSSHGIDYAPRESDVRRIYAGGPDAEQLLRKYGVSFVMISPEERNTLRANEAFFARFPVIAEAGQYKVYKVDEPAARPELPQ
jgi:hypothetical protein